MQRGAKVQVICKNKGCKKSFMARKADVARGWGKFCSKSCKAIKQEQRTGQFSDFRHSTKERRLSPNVDNETFLEYQKEYGGTPQFSRKGEFEGIVMSPEDLSYGGYGDADWNTPFGDGKW